MVRSLRLLPEKVRVGTKIRKENSSRLTFDRIGLDELRTVHKQCLGNSFPGGYRFGQAEIHVRGGKLVHVKPDVLRPRILDQILICGGATVSQRRARQREI
jgi:hypothetical protein